jgi:hypothetical protein
MEFGTNFPEERPGIHHEVTKRERKIQGRERERERDKGEMKDEK